ncbi:MAG: class I SAM-dependent methyltransferase [Bacteroidaceae bacterium]|nr:class I SAM-dependent methyltransferase [Bacteroidaceae bacterium]
MNPKYSNYNLHVKVETMEKFLNFDKFIQGEKNSLEQIRSYFRINDWAYRHFHSQDGFMHFRISSSGCFTDEDVYYQPDVVSDFIKAGDVVMELGFGQGANLLYLAHCHPDARFIGVDLSPLKKDKIVPANVTLYQQDYSSLSQFADNSVDVMYAFETIVHNTDKEKIYREVYRVLKPNGIIVIFDYALTDRFETYDADLQKAIALISKGGAAAMIESLEELNTHYTNCGLTIEKCVDHTRATLPDLKRLERKAAKILERRFWAKLMFWLLPDQFVSNIILGYLGYDSGNAGIGSYREWVLRKL